MSEASGATQNLFEYELAINRDFMKHYQFLDRHFPQAVHVAERAYEIEGRREYEFLLQIGEPMPAAEVFGRSRSLEVGGYRSDYQSLKTVVGDFRPTIVTDIFEAEGIDQVADAGALEFPDGSFAAVLAIGLPYSRTSDKPEPATLRRDFIQEAHRVLEPGGMLLMAAADMHDLERALDMGFGIELGNGCIMARMSRLEQVPVADRLEWDIPTQRTHVSMEILLHT